MEVKQVIFKRVPPGDRWSEIGAKEERVLPSLTDALEYFYQQNGTRQYYIDAAAGTIAMVLEEPDPIPQPRQFSIYGDGY